MKILHGIAVGEDIERSPDLALGRAEDRRPPGTQTLRGTSTPR
ncbi:hypothetical protein [Nocardia veterana]|nr:hypothetical protein [Nocardia veterana]